MSAVSRRLGLQGLGAAWRAAPFAAGFPWKASARSATAPAQQRSVGHVQGDKLRGNVLEAWEKREVAKIVATRNVKYFDDVSAWPLVNYRGGDVISSMRAFLCLRGLLFLCISWTA